MRCSGCLLQGENIEKQEFFSTYILFGRIIPYITVTTEPGGRLNKKDGLTRYGDSHVKDKTSWRPSYL